MEAPTMFDPDTADKILRYACRAPSVHNTQPWHWRVRDDRVDLYADFSRQLIYGDPQRRGLLISCGAALHHFQVAAQALGWSTTVRRLPDPGDERFIAGVRLAEAPTDTPIDAARTLDAIDHRRTDRRRLTSWPVPDERLGALAVAAGRWGAQVTPLVDEGARARVLDLTGRANELQLRNPRYVSELNKWT